MQLITIGVLTALSAFLACGGSAEASPFPGSVLVAGIDGSHRPASLAWAGEDETYTQMTLAAGTEVNDGPVDVQLMTALAAPEPPAIVLAGMALGGMICGRSLLRKRAKTTKTTETT